MKGLCDIFLGSIIMIGMLTISFIIALMVDGWWDWTFEFVLVGTMSIQWLIISNSSIIGDGTMGIRYEEIHECDWCGVDIDEWDVGKFTYEYECGAEEDFCSQECYDLNYALQQGYEESEL